MRFAVLQSFVSKTLATHSVRRSHHDLLVSKGPTRSSQSHCPPPRLHVVGSSSHVLSVLFRVRFRREPVSYADIDDASHEVFFSIATRAYRVHLWWFPTPSTFRSQCSSHSQRFSPRWAFWVYFTPKPRARFSFQGFSPPTSLHNSSLLRTFFAIRQARLQSTSEMRQRSRRPVQGFAPVGDPSHPPAGLALMPFDPLLGFMLPQGYPLQAVAVFRTRPPLMSFPDCISL
jgi:hypothetical protein